MLGAIFEYSLDEMCEEYEKIELVVSEDLTCDPLLAAIGAKVPESFLALVALLTSDARLARTLILPLTLPEYSFPAFALCRHGVTLGKVKL